MFHLVTHGFFKALLFLSAGSVIHSVHEQNMNKIPPRLWKKMPLTFILMLIGTLAITGIPPFAGYYSKDAIIEALFVDHSHFGAEKFAYILSIISVFFTSFYSWKLIFKIFFSKRNDLDNSIAHESCSIITGPMTILSIFAVISGFILMKYLGILEGSSIFWNNAINIKSSIEPHHTSLIVESIPLLVSFGGLFVAYYIIMRSNGGENSLVQKISPHLHNIVVNKFYIDEIYKKIFVTPLFAISRYASYFDKSILDRFGPNGARDMCYFGSDQLKKAHNGLLYKYNLWQFLVLTSLVVYFVLSVLNIL